MPRSFWVSVHRYAGLTLAAFLIVASVTGAMLAFYPELDSLFNARMFRVAERAQPEMSAQELITRVEQTYSSVRVGFVTLRREPGTSIRMSVVPRAPGDSLDFDEVFVDPFDGRVLGARMWGAARLDGAHLMPFIYKLHYTLHIPGAWGVWLMGGVALLWMLDCIVGAYLTTPRGRPFISRWRPAWQIKPDRFTYDVHRAGGLWFWLLLFMLAFTGVYFNLNDEVFRPVVSMFGEMTPSPADSFARSSEAVRPALTFDEAVQRGREYLPNSARQYELWYGGYDPHTTTYQVGFVEPGYAKSAMRLGNEEVFVDGATGAFRGSTGYVSGTSADRFMLWMYPLHSGQVMGLFGRIVICITGVAVALLSITGVVLWSRKQRVRQRVSSAAERSKDQSY